MAPAALGSMALWGLWNFLPKIALQTLPPLQVVFYEAVGNMFVSVPIFIFLKGRVETNAHGIRVTAAGATLTVISLVAYFQSLKLGPVATIATMTAMYPVVTLILARIFLKEKISRRQMTASALALGRFICWRDNPCSLSLRERAGVRDIPQFELQDNPSPSHRSPGGRGKEVKPPYPTAAPSPG